MDPWVSKVHLISISFAVAKDIEIARYKDIARLQFTGSRR